MPGSTKCMSKAMIADMGASGLLTASQHLYCHCVDCIAGMLAGSLSVVLSEDMHCPFLRSAGSSFPAAKGSAGNRTRDLSHPERESCH